MSQSRSGSEQGEKVAQGGNSHLLAVKIKVPCCSFTFLNYFLFIFIFIVNIQKVYVLLSYNNLVGINEAILTTCQ